MMITAGQLAGQFDELREKLKDRKLKAVAEAIGCSYGTLYRFTRTPGMGLSHRLHIRLVEYFSAE